VAIWRGEGARVLEDDTEVWRVNEQRRDYWLDARLISAAPELHVSSVNARRQAKPNPDEGKK